MEREKPIYILNVFGNINLSKLIFTKIYYTTKTIMSSFRICLSNKKKMFVGWLSVTVNRLLRHSDA